jgi:hypothetical protein
MIAGFKTKATLSDHIRSIVAGYPDGAYLDDGHFEFMATIFAMHPEAPQKAGAGIARIGVQTVKAYGQRPTRGFFIERTDGSRTDISWLECLHATPHRRKVMAALRQAVAPQVEAFRLRYPATREVCLLLGTTHQVSEMEVDHAPPRTFLALVSRFLESARLTFDEIRLQPTRDNDTIERLADEALRRRWEEFHRENAVLRMVSKQGNLRQKKRPTH